MKLICQYSGVSLETRTFPTWSAASGQHLIFSLSTRELLVRARNWKEQNFSELEKRLFFLALLKNTKAVHFNHPAYPAPKTVNANLSSLIKLLGAAEILETSSIKLPQFSITKDNCDIQNVHNWIGAWKETKEKYFNPLSNDYLEKRFHLRELSLSKLIHSPYKKIEDHAQHLWNWIVATTSIPEGKREIWKHLFLLKEEKKIINLSKDEILHLQDMIDSLVIEFYSISYGSLEGDVILKYLRGKLKIALGGQVGDLGDDLDYAMLLPNLSSEDGSLEEQDKKNLARWREKLSARIPKEIRHAQMIANTAPESEPRKENYSRFLDYMKAKAAWQLSQKLAGVS